MYNSTQNNTHVNKLGIMKLRENSKGYIEYHQGAMGSGGFTADYRLHSSLIKETLQLILRKIHKLSEIFPMGLCIFVAWMKV